MAGFRQKIGEGVVKWLGEMGGKIKKNLAPDPGPPVPKTQPKPEINSQTGMESPPPMTQQQMDDSIQQLGAQGDLGPLEAGKLYGRAGRNRNINLSFFEDEKTKQTIDLMNKLNDGFQDNPARQVKSQAETLKKSVKGSVDNTELRERIARVTGSPLEEKWETEDLVSIYQLMEVQAVEMQDYAKELKAMRTAGAEPSTEDLAHYQLLGTRFTAIQEIASVRAAEAGRMLNSLQAVAKGGGSQYYKDLDNIVRGAGGANTIWANIDRMAATGDLKEAAAASRQSWYGKSAQFLTQLRYNMMLSSVRTHAANVGGSLFTGLWEISAVNTAKITVNNAEYVGRYMLNKVAGTPAMRKQDRLRLSEIISVPYHTVASTRAAFGNAKKVFSGEEMGHGKIYNELGVRPKQGPGMLPTNLLEAEDAFFRSTFMNGKLRQLAHREALQQAETDADVQRLFQSKLKSPSPAMIEEASQYAGKLTFTNDPSYYGNVLGGIGKALTVIQDVPIVGRWFLPFVRTPTNLLGYAMDATGIGKVVGFDKFKADMTGSAESRADATSRVAIAFGLYQFLNSYWEEGKITGAAPANYGVTRAREAAGWRQNSIRIGDEYYELNRVDPLGLIMATYATMYEAEAMLTESDLPTEAMAGFVQVVNMISDRSVLSGLSDLVSLFQTSPGSVGKQSGKVASRIATSFIIPALVRDVREMADPYKRSIEARESFGDASRDAFSSAFFNAIPGLSGDLPPQVDAFGGDKVNIGGIIYRGIVPVRRSAIEKDPAAVALIATSVPVNKPDSNIGLPNGPQIKLLEIDGGKGWVYRDYQQRVGTLRYKLITQVTQSASWKREVAAGRVGPDTPAADMISQAVRKARRIATLELIRDLDGSKSITPKVAGEAVVGKVLFDKPFNKDDYVDIMRELAREGPSQEIKDKANEMGLKIPFKAQQKGLPPEMRF